MKTTVVAPANIALIKYWGKKNDELRLPLNSSISMNLSNCYTTTTVEFSRDFLQDDFKYLIREEEFSDVKEEKRVFLQVDMIRKLAKIKEKVKIRTQNSFPKGAGIASSASGFAALTYALVLALNLQLSKKEVSILARIGSGSACRSIPDGFVIWEKGLNSNNSYARSLYPSGYWRLCDLVVLINSQKKKTASTKGMENCFTSPFMKTRLATLPKRIRAVYAGLKNKNFQILGEALEEDAMNMHAVMMTQKPPLFYWEPTTLDLVKNIVLWRNEGPMVYFTIDAGSNLHLIFEEKNKDTVLHKIQSYNSKLKYIYNTVSDGARTTDRHLF